jgi:D-alanine-D-alanine ligase
MPPLPIICVLSGGVSAEREVSLGSGKACAKALTRFFPTRLFDIRERTLPAELDGSLHVVFSTLHGTFGEDGGMQRRLDEAGIEYAGCDAASSAITMDKGRCRDAMAALGISVARGRVFDAAKPPGAAELISELGSRIVLKPNDQGSSVGLQVIDDEESLGTALRGLTPGSWLAEERIVGREFSVGVLNGRAFGVVEIRPRSGMFDYASKYTVGLTEYHAPAPIGDRLTDDVRNAAERAFETFGCRDYARVDFMERDGGLFFLEINTLPGMKDTSLLPISALCGGLEFPALVREMVMPAVRRFQAARAHVHA